MYTEPMQYTFTKGVIAGQARNDYVGKTRNDRKT